MDGYQIKINNMKILFLDHDGVICLPEQWGNRVKKQKSFIKSSKRWKRPTLFPVSCIFDDFDGKAVSVLNEIIQTTGCEIVVSSDWREHCSLEDMGKYYELQGIIKKPIGYTDVYDLIELKEPIFPIIKEHDRYGPSTEFQRVYEISKYIKDHPEITRWAVVDDMNLSFEGPNRNNNSRLLWGLKSFVKADEATGLKDEDVKEAIINYLKE